MKTKAVSGIMLTLLLMSMLFAAFRVNETLASPEVRFYVKMPDGYIPGVPPGNLVNGPFPAGIEIWIETDVPIVMWEISLAWNPAVIQYGWQPMPGFDFFYTEGTFLSEYCTSIGWELGTWMLEGAVDIPGGTITGMVCAIVGWMDLPPQHAGATGSGLLVTLYFTSLSATDHSIIDLIDCYIYTKTQPTIPADIVEDGHYNQPPGYHTLTIAVDGFGTTDPAPGAYLYDEGTVVSVDAIPDSGYMLDHWELDTVDVGDADPYSVTMDMYHALTAFFKEIPTVQYNLTVESTPIDGVDFTVDSASYATNATVELEEGSYTVTMPSTWTVGPDQYKFIEWEDASTNPVRVISLTADKTIIAAYEFIEALPPVAAIEAPSEEYVNKAVTFDGSQSYDPDGGSIVSYRWNFGDGDVISTTNSTIVHTYATIGTYEVTLVVTDDENQESDPTKHEIRIKGPIEGMQELIENIESWNLHIGTENSLTSKLEEAILLLNMGNENGAIHKLIDFIDKVEALRSKGKLEDWQADHLTTEAQTIISII